MNAFNVTRAFFLISILVSFSAHGDYEVECSGTDAATGEQVTGTCENGDFSGYDAETGESVSGSCEFGGSLYATNDETGEQVYGECEGE